MKRKLPYRNPDDPRIFLYLSAEHKWLGVILNFAHIRSWIYYLITLTGCLVPILLLQKNVPFWTAFLILWLVLWMSVYFTGAARDLRKYPGAPSCRD